MKEEYKYNLSNYLISNNKKQRLLSILIFLIFVLVILFSVLYEIYDVKKFNAKTICLENNCTINFYINNIIKEKYDFGLIKGKKYKIKNMEYGIPELDDSNLFFQEVILKFKNYQGINNEIVEIKLYKNKEKIIKKIFELIKER